jgi:mono/diheme cytochrome c family protein
VRSLFKLIFTLVLLLLVVAAMGYWYVVSTGLSARANPSPTEERFSRRIRAFAVPARVKRMPNPVPASPEIVDAGMRHYADHCAVCHANDGSGDTLLGRGMYPRPPDLRSEESRKLTDGELFHIIENGIRFTGMPGFGEGTADSSNETWHLVRFIRHLPRVTPEQVAEMERLNPKSPEEWKALQGEAAGTAVPTGGKTSTHGARPHKH